MKQHLRAAKAALHFWEEPPISGKKGSGAIFFSGCALHCVFCQNELISRRGKGKTITPQRLSEIYQELEAQGAHNINLVTPTHFAPQIIESFKIYRPKIPVIWNSSGYDNVATLEAVAPYIDIFLPDLKYADSKIAGRYCKKPDYFQTATKAIKKMRELTGPAQFNNEGLLIKGTVVRHLVLPNNLENTFKVLDFLANMEEGTYISVMAQYTPCGDLSQYPEISRPLTDEEYNAVLEFIEEKNCFDGFIQQLDSADLRFIPSFDNSGI